MIYKGELETKFWMIIPFILFISSSKIKNNRSSNGLVYSIHITPFFSFGFIVPKFLIKG